MMDLRSLYQDIILDHGRKPRNFGALEAASHQAHGHNPLCGDTVTVYLDIQDGIVVAVQFKGHGCAISMASASLMTEVLRGKTIAQARALFANFQSRATGKTNAEPDAGAADPALAEEIERLEPLGGIAAYPTRIKCAVLPWHTLLAALDGRQELKL